MNILQYTFVYFHAQPARWTIPLMSQRTMKEILTALMEKEGLNATSLAARLIEADPSIPEEERKNYQPTIWRIQNSEKHSTRLETIQLIANYFGVTVSQLIGETPLLEDREAQTVYNIMQEIPGYKRRVLVNTALTLAEPEPEPKQYD